MRDGRKVLEQMRVVRERALQQKAEAEGAVLRDQQAQLRGSLPEVHGIACDLAGFHQRLRLLGVARASLLDLGMRAAAADSQAMGHAAQALEAATQGERHRRAAERMAMVGQRLGAQLRRRAEQSIEDELQEISSWLTP
ncbi:hypothetical protein [Stenotrophomonas maltophilia]|uniref:hypothetical protein n=1 Tax=Stenotrophomonas maltophilia TaxID=40324 RepID=UPI000BA7DA7F|nr:hypothetical protein [Stenotrophomonas maltophilia]